MGEHDRMDEGELARFAYAGAILGFGQYWRSHQPDTTDERYRRCLAAASRALAGLWGEEAAGTPGEPVEASDELIYEVYQAVDGFAYTKMNLYYAAISEGINTPMWRRQCRRSEAAARRAVASLFGEGAMRAAQARMDRENDEGLRAE